jgi:hypothetical protein
MIPRSKLLYIINSKLEATAPVYSECELELAQQILEAKDIFQWLLDHGVGAMQGMTAMKLQELKGMVR